MKRIIFILLILALICFTTHAEQAEFDPFPQNKGSVYQYGDDIPDVCFFPIDKARWNGYGVTAAKWSQLTDFQKTMFISEGAEEIERSEDVKVTIKDGWRLLIAINSGVAAVPKGTKFPVIRLLRDLLKMDGNIKLKKK